MRFLYLLLFCFSFPCFCQETVKVVFNAPNQFYAELYYVLKSDKKILHGKYYKVSTDNKLLVSGKYTNGKKDSTWVGYNMYGGISSKGDYLEDARIGIWEFYNNTELESKYDYTNKLQIYYQNIEREKSIAYKIVNGEDFVYSLLDNPPMYIEGSTAMYKTILQNMRYPRSAVSSGRTGKAYVSFVIDSTGKAINHKLVKKLSKDLDNEALRVVKLVADNWIPGRLKGIPVNIELTIPVAFNLHE